ncbi:glutamate--tRNA ligase [Candidatus Parcubacteria bacterium]|nr:glutamate--tRNA ligase [Candidatus Parcubacteria bacterium]
MKQPVRVRFAPSPTGSLHLGGIRSALFNWLYSRKSGGRLVLRIEDTDRERYVPEAVNQIQESLAWLGLEPDEGGKAGGQFGPYAQSERLPLYKTAAEKLVADGWLYPCWCSSERLTQLRQAAQANHTAFKYDRYCLKHPQDKGGPHVLRFKVPDEPATVRWDDAVKGMLEFQTKEQDDFVAVKSDGYPTYNFANVVDDHAMQISHVLRAEEFIPSTPKHILLYQAYGWETPVFAHLPQVLGSDKSKLSKRHGAKSVLEYRDEGYLPEAVINFLAGLGWNAGEGSTKEIYTREELTNAFSLERVQSSPAVFDPERLNWLNGVYIRSLPLDRLAEACAGFWPAVAAKAKADHKKAVLALVQERLKYLAELPELTRFFFTDPASLPFDQLKTDPAAAKTYLQASLEGLEAANFTHAELEATLRGLAERLEVKPGALFGVVRVAITGQTAAPGLFETMLVLGREAVLRRLKTARDRLAETAKS